MSLTLRVDYDPEAASSRRDPTLSLEVRECYVQPSLALTTRYTYTYTYTGITPADYRGSV